MGLGSLAFLPESERKEVIRYNLPRVREYGVYDEVYLRTEIERVCQLGYAGRNTNRFDGMAGVGVPVRKREATAIGAQINPFDPALRHPAQSLAPSDSD